MALTDVKVRNAKVKPKAYKLADSNGFFLQVTTSGSELWRMKFRYSGKEGLLSFGPYPEVTLAEARGKRDQARRQMREGLNPSLEKRRAAIVAKAAAANTFALLAEEVVAKREREGLAPTTAAKLRWYASLLGKVSSRPVGEIEAFELLEPLRRTEASGRHKTAPAISTIGVTNSNTDRWILESFAGQLERRPLHQLLFSVHAVCGLCLGHRLRNGGSTGRTPC